jgi:hypothetical protein
MRKLMTGAVSTIIAFMLISPGTETPAQALAIMPLMQMQRPTLKSATYSMIKSSHMGWPKRPVMGRQE